MKDAIRKWLAEKLPAWFSTEAVSDAIGVTSPMERCRLLYQTIDFSAFRNYKQSNSHGRKITVVHANIESCIADLVKHIETLDNSGYVLQTSVEYNAVTIPLARFFVTKDGFYLESIYITLQSLQDAVVGLCKAVDEAKHVEYDTKPYNQRMLNSLFHVLIDLGMSLEEISNETQK